MRELTAYEVEEVNGGWLSSIAVQCASTIATIITISQFLDSIARDSGTNTGGPTGEYSSGGGFICENGDSQRTTTTTETTTIIEEICASSEK